MDQHHLLFGFVVMLTSSVVLVPLFRLLGLSAVLGYLSAGLLIGPYILGWVESGAEMMKFSELGVVFLLFLVGIELSPERLWSLRRKLLVLGLSQLILTTVVIGGVAALLISRSSGGSAFTNSASLLVVGLAFALSSTAIALQIVRERNLLPLASGQSAFLVLLFQDLAVVPILALLPLLASQRVSHGAGITAYVKGAAALIFVIIAGRYLTRPIFRFIGKLRLREMFTAFSLLLILSVAYLMESVGLSMALGAFVAGVLLANSEYRHELESDIEPFKGLLLGLFFISVGMSIDIPLFLSRPGLVMGLTLGTIALKALALFAVGRISKLGLRDNLHFSTALAQVSEFAFVILGLAQSLGLLTSNHAGLAGIVAVMSMFVCPVIFMAVDRYWVSAIVTPVDARESDVRNEGHSVVIAGFGRVGGVVSRALAAQGISSTAIDHDATQVDFIRKWGLKAYYGDIARIDILRAAGIEQAKLLILTIDDMEATEKAIDLVQRNFPHVEIIARARNRQSAARFMQMGVTHISRETFESSLEIAELAFGVMGGRKYQARRFINRFRLHDIEMLKRSLEHRENIEKLISLGNQGRADFAQLLKEDAEKREETEVDTWG